MYIKKQFPNSKSTQSLRFKLTVCSYYSFIDDHKKYIFNKEVYFCNQENIDQYLKNVWFQNKHI